VHLLDEVAQHLLGDVEVAITPSLSGRIAEIVPGVRPSMRLASIPTAWTSPVRESIATTEGSDSTIPRPRTYTSVFAGAEVDRHVAATEAGEIREEAHW
jgi:hypothetical protein